MGSVGSDESNNWGMDDSIDVNAVRLEPQQCVPTSDRFDNLNGGEFDECSACSPRMPRILDPHDNYVLYDAWSSLWLVCFVCRKR